MASTTLIRVIQGKRVREYRYSAIMGDFFSRIEKAHGNVDIADTELESKLTKEELAALYSKFPYLNANRELPPIPNVAKVAFREEPEPVADVIEEQVTEPEAVVNEESFNGMEVDELKAYLNEQGVKYDKRKKTKDYFVELALQTIK